MKLAYELLGDITDAFVAGDSAYDAGPLRELLERHHCTVVIPSNPTRAKQHDLDRHLYKERHLVECFFQRIKRMRRIAMRYEGTSPRDLTPQPPSPWRERGAKRKIATSTPDATIDPV
jgi:hypothetical protein